MWISTRTLRACCNKRHRRCVAADFALCWSATSALQSLFASLTPTTELFSLDESFIHFTSLTRLYTSPMEFTQVLHVRIHAQLGKWVNNPQHWHCPNTVFGQVGSAPEPARAMEQRATIALTSMAERGIFVCSL